jgi:biopolymer transport protein ExbB
MSVIELLIAGGIVMVPLVGASLVAVALIIERILFWRTLYQQQLPFMSQVLETYEKTPQVAIQQLQKHQHFPMARIFWAALALEQATPEEFRLALESAAQAELPLLKRFSTIFETIVGIAPLLGLLGTVLGLIRALSSLGIGEAVGERAMGVSEGIGEALVSTAFGLIVALFTLLFANLFQGLYRRQRAAIESYSGRLEILYRRYYRQYLQRQRDRKP